MPFLLLVEGSDDQHLIRNVAREHGIDLEPKELRDCGGVESLLEIFSVALKGTATLAAVVDDDADLGARWQSVADRLRAAGYDPPDTPPPGGLLLTSRRPAVGVWLMPDNSIPGALEDFAKHLIPSGDALWPRAVDAVSDIPAAERRFKATQKAEIHTYLAWQEEPGTPLGLAVTKRYFRTDSDLCKRFIHWLRRLKEMT